MIEISEDKGANEPRRDARGRFRAGCTGNPNGRPPKEIARPWSFAESVSRAFSEEIEIIDASGVRRRIELREALVKTFARGCLKVNAKDLLPMVERLLRLNALNPADEPEDEAEIFTEEDRRLLEIIQKDVAANPAYLA